MFAHMMKETKITFNVAGDTQLDPGTVIQFNVPQRTNNQQYDPQLAGQYVIGGLRHGYSSGKLNSTLECYRFGFPTSILASNT